MLHLNEIEVGDLVTWKGSDGLERAKEAFTKEYGPGPFRVLHKEHKKDLGNVYKIDTDKRKYLAWHEQWFVKVGKGHGYRILEL